MSAVHYLLFMPVFTEPKYHFSSPYGWHTDVIGVYWFKQKNIFAKKCVGKKTYQTFVTPFFTDFFQAYCSKNWSGLLLSLLCAFSIVMAESFAYHIYFYVYKVA